ncbi:MAG: tetratricopeptide (TPR) repeat protein [Flavobacteriales bacterium]|jgi:tetratricopeptide (TPR) repeat protein
MADIENFDVQDIMDRVQGKYEENKNYVFIALAAVILIIGGTWWYQNNKESQNLEANNLIWKQDQNFDTDNFETAINGTTNNVGYAYIADEYNGTSAGDIATYNMGVGYLNLGKYNEAIDALEDVDFEDIILGAIAKGATGDAYFELGKVDKAISNYKAAVSHSDNELTVPVYLKKLAIAQEAAGDMKDAIESYQRIKDDYSTAPEARDIEKFIARLQAKQ